MATYKNTTAFIRGGKIYSNGSVLATNQSQQADYFPSSVNTLSDIQQQMQELAACGDCNGTLNAIPICVPLPTPTVTPSAPTPTPSPSASQPTPTPTVTPSAPTPTPSPGGLYYCLPN